MSRLRPFVCFTDKGRADWDTHLPAMSFAINTVVHSFTETAPNEVTYGHFFDLPSYGGPAVSVARYVRNTQVPQKRNYDRRHTEVRQGKENGLVWVHKKRNLVECGRNLHT